MTENRDDNYLEVNRESWDRRTEIHYKSEFYGVSDFIKGKSSLNEIELQLLGKIEGKRILHLQCHFGQDTISLSRLGAKCVGVDFSQQAISRAEKLASITKSSAQFICSDIYSLPEHLDGKFDIVFTSYGTVGWLPNINKWAKVAGHFCKTGGTFIMADFHPMLWMMDDNFTHFKYSYFNRESIMEEAANTYAERETNLSVKSITWNHPISDILNALIGQNLNLISFQEFDYSPYDCFAKTIEKSPGKFTIKHLGDKLPMVYSIKAIKQ